MDCFTGYVRGLIRQDMETQKQEQEIEDEEFVLMDAIDAYGSTAQEWVFVGEVGELLDAIADKKRGRCGTDHIAEEIADVEIMLTQMKMIYRCEERVAEWRKQKVQRLAEQLKGG